MSAISKALLLSPHPSLAMFWVISWIWSIWVISWSLSSPLSNVFLGNLTTHSINFHQPNGAFWTHILSPYLLLILSLVKSVVYWISPPVCPWVSQTWQVQRFFILFHTCSLLCVLHLWEWFHILPSCSGQKSWLDINFSISIIPQI